MRDIEGFLAPDRGAATSGPYELLRAELAHIFATKQRLGLPSIPERMRALSLEGFTQRPEVLFVIANHVPASRAFGRELLRLPPRLHADYFVATVEWMGYALFAENMVPLDEFIAECSAGGRRSAAPARERAGSLRPPVVSGSAGRHRGVRMDAHLRSRHGCRWTIRH